ncbi:nuclear transport factor 2 family protein [Cesiribacter sp. SM1]|uniref:nuclear transport factor 2 family protein n=1 Tax=Cesiribacter sp. SM1 TaxID=2861196 RepID=UPI001CD7BD5B|nr:nuclear transport factor 2 family protein [Cesiribacter sp. SM1]
MANTLLAIQTLYTDFNQGNLSKILSLIDCEVIIHKPESLPYGNLYVGREGFVNLMSSLYKTWSSLQMIPESIIASGDIIVASGELIGKVSSVTEMIHMPFVHVWKMPEEHITEIWFYYWDTALLLKYFGKSKQ